MNAILLSLALLGQFDMGGRSPNEFLMGGDSPRRSADFIMADDSPRTRGVMITASWCPPCRAFKVNEIPRLVKGGWKVGEKETDHLQLVEHTEGNVTLPTFLRLVDGKEVARHFGSMNADQLAEFIYPKKAVAGDASAPTPGQEVERVIGVLPKPQIGFVDWGCGDGRWCIAAAERWPDCRVVGIEIDPARAAATRERVQMLGLSGRITIITGDATTTEVDADVGVAYLYAPVLEQLRPRIEKLRAFASYRHQPPGLPVVRNGDTWLYVRGTQAVQQSRPAAVWQGQYYTDPVCVDPNCGMCRSIRKQLGQGIEAPAKNSIWWSLF